MLDMRNEHFGNQKPNFIVSLTINMLLRSSFHRRSTSHCRQNKGSPSFADIAQTSVHWTKYDLYLALTGHLVPLALCCGRLRSEQQGFALLQLGITSFFDTNLFFGRLLVIAVPHRKVH
jgi:hypothetical protein